MGLRQGPPQSAQSSAGRCWCCPSMWRTLSPKADHPPGEPAVEEVAGMMEAYSGLKFLLEERSLTPAELQRRIAAGGQPLPLKALHRLADPDRPLERLDMRVVGA